MNELKKKRSKTGKKAEKNRTETKTEKNFKRIKKKEREGDR